MPKVKQIWWCERCLKVGSVILDKHAGLTEGVDAVHESHRKASPECPTNNVHALNLDGILRKVLPYWAANRIYHLLVDVQS
jgi:hypothetical protein